MENIIKKQDLINFLDKIKDDKHWIGSEAQVDNHYYKLMCFIIDCEAKKKYESQYNRDDLDILLSNYVEDYNETLVHIMEYEIEDLNNLVKEIAKQLLPIWKDDSKKYVKLSDLIEYYKLNIDDLYYDSDGNCIRDNEGNIWYD